MGKISRKKMIDFLNGHQRYHTMNSWNNAHSYAHNIKIRNWVPKELEEAAYKMLEVREPFRVIESEFNTFGRKHDWEYQMWWNGKSGGYIVLGIGGIDNKNPHKTKCDTCGRLTWYEEEQNCHVSGCEGMLLKLEQPRGQIFTQPGKGLDMDRDYEDWDVYLLHERYQLVKEFDAVVDKCKKIFLRYCKEWKVVERVRMVPQDYKALERRA